MSINIMSEQLEKTTLAGGCFWCIEAAFNSLVGIEHAVSGYMGGDDDEPNYEAICQGDTGHAEVVQLTFDHKQISFEEILEIFFTLHDPTQLNKQGNDIGTQYRSAIFFHNEKQQQIANAMINDLDTKNIWPEKIVTEVVAKSTFYKGEDYHQEYFTKNPENPYCQAVVSPKLAKFRKTFASKLKR